MVDSAAGLTRHVNGEFQPSLISALRLRNNRSIASRSKYMFTQNASIDALPPASATSPRRTLSIEFHQTVPAAVRHRMTYAFRVFAAIYGHLVVDTRRRTVDCLFTYGGPQAQGRADDVIPIPAIYHCKSSDQQPVVVAAPMLAEYAGETIPVFFGTDPETGNPDWLGEIFLWLSGELEQNAKQRDAVGRVPFSETPFGKHGLSPRRPHAAHLMAWLESVLRQSRVSTLPKAPSPLLGAEHILLPSHDIDFHFDGRRSAFVRLTKNLAIAAGVYKNSTDFSDNLKKIPRLLAGERPGDYLLPLVDALQSAGFQSTLFPVVRQGHRRDPNYSLESIAPNLSKAVASGLSLGLHGSYQSVMEDRSLASEAATLGERMGKWPRANRQHWLRFESQQALFREVASAGMLADSSLGFPQSVGFRNGANFAFPPYDFARECPHRFLEIPLVLMDGGLEAEARNLRHDAQGIAEEILNASRRIGWGGISILWHNPMEALSVPREINEVFWRLAAKRCASNEAWLSFDQFLSAVTSRYQEAGLMEGISVNA